MRRYHLVSINQILQGYKNNNKNKNKKKKKQNQYEYVWVFWELNCQTDIKSKQNWPHNSFNVNASTTENSKEMKNSFINCFIVMFVHHNFYFYYYYFFLFFIFYF